MKAKILSIFSLMISVVLPMVLFAQDVTIKNPIKSNNLITLIKTVLEFVLKLGIPVIALAVIYSGFLFVSARGNARELETAKRSIMYTLLGAAILLGSWAIAQLIAETVLSL